MDNNILLEKKLPYLFVYFVIPSIIAMVIAGAQGMVDGIFLGNFAGSDAMASVNIANPYLQIIIGCTMIVCTGTLSFLGRTLGENKPEKAKDIFRSSVVALLIISLILMFAGIIFYKNIAYMLGANEVLVKGTGQYIFVIAIFAPAISFMLLFGFTDRLLEKPHLYLIATVFSLMANIGMDFLAVKILKMGVRGAALATGFSYLMGLLFVIKPVLSKKSVVNVFEGKCNWNYFKDSAYNGSSEGIISLSTAVILFLFNRAFMDLAGEDGVAAFTIINYIGNFATLIMFGVSDGISSIVSCNYGAGKMERVHRTFFAAISINFLMGVVLVFILNLFSKNLISVFLEGNEKILEMAVGGAKLYALSFLLNGFNIVQSGYHTAVGNALISVVIAASRGIIFSTVGILILPHFLRTSGIWITPMFAETVTLILCILIMKKKRHLYFRD